MSKAFQNNDGNKKIEHMYNCILSSNSNYSSNISFALTISKKSIFSALFFDRGWGTYLGAASFEINY